MIAGVVVCAAAAAAIAVARVPTNPSSAARTTAERILAKAPLPTGATVAATDPSGGALAQASFAPATPNLVDVHSFWRVPSDPDTVIAWIKAHPPAGSDGAAFQGETRLHGKLLSQLIGYSFAQPVSGVVPWETLAITAISARGGGTALRVDASVVWLLKRSPSERIPAGARSVAVSERGLNGHRSGSWTVAAPARVARAVSLIDRLPSAQPGVSSCPADTGPYVTLKFLSRGGADLATAAIDGSGCLGVGLSIHGPQQHALQGNAALIKQLSTALGLEL